MIRKPTQLLRETLTQEWRTLLGPEQGATATSVRRVQLVIPNSPDVQMYLTESSGDAAKQPQQLGLDREYKGAQVASGARMTVHLLAHQSILGSARTGTASVSLFVEYLA